VAAVLPATVATRLPGRSSGPPMSLVSCCTVSADVTVAVNWATSSSPTSQKVMVISRRAGERVGRSGYSPLATMVSNHQTASHRPRA